MATLVYSLSSKTDKVTELHEVLIRFFHGRLNQRAKSGIFISAEYWNDELQRNFVPKFRLMNNQQRALVEELTGQNETLQKLSAHRHKSFIEAGAGKDPLPKDWLVATVDMYMNPPILESSEEEQIADMPITEVFDFFMERNRASVARVRHYKVVWRMLRRYELYNRVVLKFDDFTADTLRDIEAFLTNEHTLKGNRRYESICKEVDDSRSPAVRGGNTVSSKMKILRTFFLWAINNEYTDKNPFRKYSIKTEVYGTPYYITLAERKQLLEADLSAHPHLERQRDIFIFQSVIGCRVSGLWAMTKANVVNGFVEYIARKTKENRPVTVRVPLNDVAKSILEKYKDLPGQQLLPFTSQQQYNRDIKTMFEKAGLDRIVTVINPKTREEEKKRLCDIASSHLARRTFIGNLYKETPDPNIIGKLSGHKEGSRAFARYRDIDDDMLTDLVSKLN